MRRVAVSLAVVLVLSIAPASAGPQLAPYAGVDQAAASIWFRHEGGQMTLYIAAGGRSADNHPTVPDLVGLPAYGLVGRGPCKITKKGGFCRLRGKIYPLVTEYEMDPLMESAHMTLDTGRYTHVVDWTGEQTVSQDSDQEGTELYFYMYRPASVKATLYNKKFNGGDAISIMQNSVQAGDAARLLQLHDDGTFSARIELDRNGSIKLDQSRRFGSIGMSTPRSSAISMARP
jgi:hypothetical protein